MNKPITVPRLLFALCCFLLLETTLSVAGFHYAKQAKTLLQRSFPARPVHIVSAAWMGVDCGRFRIGDEPAGETHRFLIERGTVTTDMTTGDPQGFDDGWRRCVWMSHGRGDWQNPIFDAVVLPFV